MRNIQKICLVILLGVILLLGYGGMCGLLNKSDSGSSAKQIRLTSDAIYKGVKNNETVTYHVTIHNDSGFTRPIKVTGTPAAGNWVVTYYDPITGTDITGNMTGTDGFSTPAVTPTGSYTVQLEVTPISVELGSSLNTFVTGSFADAPQETDDIKPRTQRILKPTIVGSYDTPMTPTGIYVIGNYAYIADKDSLQIIDISTPTTPTFAGSYDMLPYDEYGFSRGVYVLGNYAYVTEEFYGDYSGRLYIIDISNPASPTLAGLYNGHPYSTVYVLADYAYLKSPSIGVDVVNISNPAAPVLVGSLNIPSTGYYGRIYVSGNYAYSANEWSGLNILNISNPANPTSLGLYNTASTELYGIYILGNYAYIANGPSGLNILNISNPAAPILAGFYDPTPDDDYYAYIPGINSARDVYVVDNYAYVAFEGSLQIIDVSNTAIPVFSGAVAMPPDFGVYAVHVSGEYAYVVSAFSGLHIVRLTE